MRFLIIAANECSDPYPVYPLGMSVIAAAAAKAGHEVRQFDAMANGIGTLPETIAQFKPEAIGISIRNLDTVNSKSDEKNLLKTPLRIVKLCRENSSVPLILGGSGFSLLPEKIMELCAADYGIAGEGEAVIAELLAKLEPAAKDPLFRAPHDLRVGAGPRQGRTPLTTEKNACAFFRFERNKSSAQTIFRARHSTQSQALYQKDILDFYQKETHIIPIQTKRGCPFNCAYCTYPALEGHEVRERSTHEVIAQMTELHGQYPDSMFYFVDAVFNDPQKKWIALLKEMQRTRLRIPFAAFLSPFALNEPGIELMRDCGMIAAELGLDASTDETLRGLQKNFTFREAAEASALLLKHGIGVTTNVMFGGPGETYDTVGSGIANLRAIEPAHTLIFSGIRLIPDAPLYEIAKREGKIPPDWDGVSELYYFADGIESEKLHSMLTDGFAGSRFCIYPPHAKNGELKLLHKLGYAKMRKMNIGAAK